MYRDHSIGVVVPAYNEEGLIGDVIDAIPDYVDRVYVIDDDSSDGTWDEILRAAQRDANESGMEVDITPEILADGGMGLLEKRSNVYSPIGRIVPIKHRGNRGAGGAIKTGYLAALQDDIDIAVTVDGDGQMDLGQMPKLLDPIVDDEADYAKGNRLLYKSYREDMPPFRFVGNAILTFLTKVASGYWKTMDPQNGYTAISIYALENVGIESLYEYYGYCNDLLVKLNAKGMRVADVAIPAVYGEEDSTIRYPTYIWNVSGMLLKTFLWRLKVKYLVLDFHPLAFFYYFGALMAFAGIVGAGVSGYTFWTGDGDIFMRSAMSLLVFSVGSMFLMFAMLFDMQVNQDQETQIQA